jgi:hypothetical protein
MLLAVLFASAEAVTFEALVADPVSVLLSDRDTPGGFRMIALSHAAEACVGRYRSGTWDREQATTCVDRIAEAALDPRLSPYGAPVSEVRELGEHGLWLSHLAIVLGARDQLHPEACDRVLHERIAAHLEAAALAHPAGVGRSYPSSPCRWPADQAATLYALWLEHKAHGTDHLTGPRERYLAWLPTTGLPRSELTGSAPDSELPRGSAVAFTVRYLAPVAPEVARDLWGRAEAAGFVQRMGPLAGLREWAPGVERAADIDSGPIVGGLGASATAFGRAAARAVGDDEAAKALDRTAALGHRLAASGGFTGLEGGAATSALAAAITAQSER